MSNGDKLLFTADDFKDVDWGKLGELIGNQQVKLLNTLTDEQLRELTAGVDEIEASAARRDRVLGFVQFLGRIGLRLAGI